MHYRKTRIMFAAAIAKMHLSEAYDIPSSRSLEPFIFHIFPFKIRHKIIAV